MKVFTATSKTQGQRKNDFCHVPEGELVKFATECDGESVDGGCGCRRSMVGVATMTATTTFTVEDKPDLTKAEYRDILHRSLAKGWGNLFSSAELLDMAVADADELLRLAGRFPAGMILEKRGNTIQERASVEKLEKSASVKTTLKVGDRISTSVNGRPARYANRHGVVVKLNPKKAIIALDAEYGYPAERIMAPYSLIVPGGE